MRSIRRLEQRTCALRPATTMRLAIVLALSFLAPGDCDLLRDSVHVTSAAAKPNNELWCYKCLAEDPDGPCADLRHNNSALIHQCNNEKRMCMVKRFSYTTSNENSTTALKMWALERNCTKHCEAGCIVIGERTKLYACTSCCTTSLCNYGSGAQQISIYFLINTFITALALLI
ncbi:uncharacterized protein LOC116766677 isoform X2 [Danaus plexippus]|uniref:Uncharacterized protein n=1 Tax=Danaus plexippus plexippus TaxID=278856 RepID=A0A212FPD8_DANPL|nr:uncharacterized protein LOC116766677 isoform X2 [Danaus plexippus]OWR55595.1 hypothetical protein KGM_208903 [Danaus plexippus plexippus]